ncbi:sensor histidine kinase [Clostridioides difficile]|nr:sensor histidine kinase [Clostridioides difficile]MBZ0632407.1 ATP-binding protein [Clostridioides difficile]MBZ0658265.1 ATP-binding protein [Clostridioides difficile]HBF9262886.1 sensor histidine kinase [Clostridioides difficile]HBF9360009.1 sensor histidine kinase [Clostridioides difficile]
MLDSNYIWILITLTIITLELILLNKIIINTSHIRVSKLNLRITLVLLISFIMYTNLCNIYPEYRVIMGISLTIIYYRYICYENIIKVIIIPLIYWMIVLGIDSFSMSIIVWINSLDSMSVLIAQNIYRLQSIILSKGILIIVVMYYCKLRINLYIYKRDIVYMLIPIISNIVSSFVIYRYVSVMMEAYILEDKVLIIISCLLIISNMCLVLSIRKSVLDNKKIAEANLIKEKMKIQYTHYINTQRDYMKVRQLHHDIKNHIACIKGVTQSNKDATNYISSIEDELNRYDNSFNTGNMILDIILNEKNKVCKESNIKLLIDINNFEICSFIDTIDICSIFSNIFDNAIEACEKISHSGKEINLRGTIVNKFYVIRMENTKQNKINVKNNYIKTDKKDTYLHGLGIKSVEDSVSKYNGEVVIEYSEDRFIMKIFVPLVPK